MLLRSSKVTLSRRASSAWRALQLFFQKNETSTTILQGIYNTGKFKNNSF